MIRLENVSFSYTDNASPALRDIDLTIADGEFLGIIGHNGSGKSTFAKMLNGILRPQKGTVIIDGMVMDDECVWEIRRLVALIFQNPENQIVGTTVREDVAFGVENLGLDRDELLSRVNKAMSMVGIDDIADEESHSLSGGQKQLVTIAGALAMQPHHFVLDEAASMLDFSNRRQFLDIMMSLKKTYGSTIIYITHFLEDLVKADRVAVFHHGRLAKIGKPSSVLTDSKLLKELGLEPLQITEFIRTLNDRGLRLPDDLLSIDQVVESLCY